MTDSKDRPIEKAEEDTRPFYEPSRHGMKPPPGTEHLWQGGPGGPNAKQRPAHESDRYRSGT